MSLTEEEKMDRAGSEKLPKAAKGGGSRQVGIKNLQRTLESIGMSVRRTGVVDQATVDAINAVFTGWDDAPAKMRAGNLTAAQISSNLPTISKYLHLALSGAKDFGDATKES